MKHILLTGASGLVGTALRPWLAKTYDRVHLTDRQPLPSPPAANETFTQGDITELSFVSRLLDGVDGIAHLAGLVGAKYTYHDVLGPNFTGTYNIYEAARLAGISRVVYASSHHAVGFHPRGTPIDHTTAPRPDGYYGLSKAFGEATGSYFADAYGLHVLAIRIGYVGENVVNERRLHTWISARDLAQLIHLGLTAPDLGYQVVYGISENPDPFFDNANATRLGYRPQDRALDHLADPALSEAKPDETSLEGRLIGGQFCEVSP